MSGVNKDEKNEQRRGEPLSCLLWGTFIAFGDYYQIIKYYELSGSIVVRGITSSVTMYRELGGYEFIPADQINSYSFDIVIAMSNSSESVNEICSEASNYGIEYWNVIPCSVMRLIGFDFDKYRELRKHPPSIFAPNCWGGNMYHRLGLRFESPFINMFEDHDDYLKILSDPKHYMSCELQFKEMIYEENLKRDYPVAVCDDVLLYFNHATSFDEANADWIRRRDRIDWDNLFVMFYDEDPKRVERFCDLQYKRKVCFVPFGSDRKDVISVNYRVNKNMEEMPFFKIVNGMANGRWPYYDVFDLLLYNRFTPVAELEKI